MPRYRILTRKIDELTPAGQLIAHTMAVLEFETPLHLADPVQALLAGERIPLTSYCLTPYAAETPATLYLSEPLRLTSDALTKT